VSKVVYYCYFPDQSTRLWSTCIGIVCALFTKQQTMCCVWYVKYYWNSFILHGAFYFVFLARRAYFVVAKKLTQYIFYEYLLYESLYLMRDNHIQWIWFSLQKRRNVDTTSHSTQLSKHPPPRMPSALALQASHKNSNMAHPLTTIHIWNATIPLTHLDYFMILVVVFCLSCTVPPFGGFRMLDRHLHRTKLQLNRKKNNEEHASSLLPIEQRCSSSSSSILFS